MGESHNKLQSHQMCGLDGQPLNTTNIAVKIAGSTTVTVFTGSGVFTGLIIWIDVDGGTIHFTDINGSAITGLPDSTNKGMTDYPGTFHIPRLQLTNGLKVVTASATGLVATAFAFQ